MSRRVLTLAPLPPEKSAYALARYSRSPDSIRDSIAWVRTHDSRRFLESFYFQYGHASIADLGHCAVCFEDISELAAIEIEDEPLWDGQAKSSRYQDFSRTGWVTPPELADSEPYRAGAARLLDAYQRVHAAMRDYYRERLPRPAEVKPDAYERNIAARAFDVARYLLFLGIPTNVGQVTSIRTLEKQVRRLKASPHAELRELAQELAEACAEPPQCGWSDPSAEPLCPTLARHVEPDEHLAASRRDLAQWAAANLSDAPLASVQRVDVLRPVNVAAEAAATLLYPVTDRSFRDLYEQACAWPEARRAEVIDTALRSRSRRDELLRGFRGGQYAFDIIMDIGAYRDLHRHRRCQQYRQALTAELGFETPRPLADAGLAPAYEAVLRDAYAASAPLTAPEYLLPFATRSRFLFKMDFAEAEYIIKLRSGVKGHFSYRQIAWEMKEALARTEPELARLIEATPPWIEDPLTR